MDRDEFLKKVENLRLMLNVWHTSSNQKFPSEALGLLTDLWDSFSGSDATSMDMLKLHRLEDPTWRNPLLTFRLERHGRIMHGSSRAEMYTWTIDLNLGTATCREDGYRQKEARAKPLKVEPICKEVAALIHATKDHECLKWSDDFSRVTVRIGKVIPEDSYKQTIAGRRKRFRQCLLPILHDMGWEPVVGSTPNTYERR